MLRGEETRLGLNFPFYPVSSPGMPKPGQNYVSEARSLVGTERTKIEGVTDDASYEYALNWLYYLSLYDDNFQVSIELPGRKVQQPIILGHQWGFEADGPRESRVMVVGKCPSREEAEARRFGVGPAATTLREVLDELQVEGVDEWYMTAAVKFPNPKAGQTNTVSKTWINDCRPLLEMEMRLVRPKYILLLGAEAISAVLGSGSNNKNTNGRVIDHKIQINAPGQPEAWHECQIVTCISPGNVQHDPSKRDELYKSLRYFRAVLDGTLATVSGPELTREHIFCFDAEHLNQIANRMEAERKTEFAIDCEFDGDTPIDGKLHTVQFSWQDFKACAVNIRDVHGNVTFKGGIHALQSIFTRIFKGRDKRIIGHYFNADLWWLKSIGLGFLQDQFAVPPDDPDPDGVNRFWGWQKLMYYGGFDTILAAHAHEETSDFGLKELAIKHTSAGNYEVELERWKTQRARELGISMKDLPGFGACPREILLPYGAYDADVTFRLYTLYNKGLNGRKALLDCDRFGMSSRQAFWTSMRASLAFYEMHEVGVIHDLTMAEELSETYQEVLDRLIFEFRRDARWPNFNPSSVIDKKEFLFGTRYNGKFNKATGENIQVRPEGGVSLHLPPYKSTGKRPKMWDWVRARNKENEYTPSCDKETLSVYETLNPGVAALRDIGYIQHVLRFVLRPPRKFNNFRGEDEVFLDEDGNPDYDRGLASFRTSRGTIHSNYSQTKDTGRSGSWGPPMQNVTKKREEDYKRIAGAHYKYPLRSMFVAPPGWAFVSADYTGAELYMMAIQARSKSMVDHCVRANLPSKGHTLEGLKCEHGKGCKECIYPHADYYDIHSNVAVQAFRPKYPDGRECRPGRFARFDLVQSKNEFYRDAAKPVDFGYAYGMTADAAYRKAREGKANVTIEDSQALLDGLEELYPDLPIYYAKAAARSREQLYMVNCSGRRRRTFATQDQKAMGDIERKFKNFPIQSGVADAASLAMANFVDYRLTHVHLQYKIVLMIHDDIVLLTPIPQLEEVYDEVIPYCMRDAVDIWPTDFEGVRTPDPSAPYHLSPDRHVYLRWGVEPTKAECEAAGIPTRFGK